MASPWSQDEDDYLRAHYNKGLSATEIGRKLKRGRNAVIGRANRLKLCTTVERFRDRQQAEAKIARAPKEKKPTVPARPPRVEAEAPKPRLWDLSKALPFEALRPYTTSRPNQCRWPVAGDLFCAEVTAVSESYCPDCRKLAYRPAKKHERRLTRYVMYQAAREGRAVYG